MNRSFSKIRHIQEANRILERRILNEQVTGDTTTTPVVSLDKILSNSPNVPFMTNSVKKYNNEVVTWNQFVKEQPRSIDNTFYKNCNTGELTNKRKVTPNTYQSSFATRLCISLFPDLQVAVNTREYSEKQKQYTKDNPLQTGAPTTQYRSDGSLI
jgi:hypothetical protein